LLIQKTIKKAQGGGNTWETVNKGDGGIGKPKKKKKGGVGAADPGKVLAFAVGCNRKTIPRGGGEPSNPKNQGGGTRRAQETHPKKAGGKFSKIEHGGLGEKLEHRDRDAMLLDQNWTPGEEKEEEGWGWGGIRGRRT